MPGAPKGRCNLDSAHHVGHHRVFQSSPAPKGRCNLGQAETERPLRQFQSSPAPKGRCNLLLGLNLDAWERRLLEFQSSPAPKGRCNSNSALLSIATQRFNPHRPRRADATVAVPTTVGRNALPFQSSPAPKGRCNLGRCLRPHSCEIVSILTGPEGPMQRTASTSSLASAMMFQSSPAPKGRCNPYSNSNMEGQRGFNPHRPRRADATIGKPVAYIRAVVSILTGPEGPMQPTTRSPATCGESFQSSPAPKGRCNTSGGLCSTCRACFNPHRPRRADATRV